MDLSTAISSVTSDSATLVLTKREKFIQLIRKILQLKDPQSSVMLLTHSRKDHYIRMECWDEFVHSESNEVKTVVSYEFNNFTYDTLAIENIFQVGYLPKNSLDTYFKLVCVD